MPKNSTALEKTTIDESPANSASAAIATQQILIQGVLFTATAPYSAGHVLNAEEAVALNQTRAENLRNNFSSKVKAALEAAAKENGGNATLSEETLSTLATNFAAYDSAYTFNGKRQSAAPLDPIGKEAHKIAKSLITEGLRKKNIDLKTLPEGKLEELIKSVLAKNPDIRAEAERRIAATKAVASAALDLDDLVAPAPTAQTTGKEPAAEAAE